MPFTPIPPTPSAGGGGSKEATVFVAASDARPEVRAAADFVCDGMDDMEQIVLAYNQILPLSGGGKILLSEGTFHISYGFELMRSDLTIEGMGNSTILRIVDFHSQPMDIFFTSFMTLSNITFRNMRFEGNRHNQSAAFQRGLVFNWVTNPRVENVTFNEFFNEGVVYNTCWSGEIRNSRFTSGASLALGVLGGGRNLTAHNFFDTNQQGIRLFNENRSKLFGNIIQNSASHGIVVELCFNSHVTNNTITDSQGIGLRVWDFSDSLVITDNMIDWNNVGVSVEDSGFSLLSNNDISYNRQHGLVIHNTSQLQVVGNILRANSNFTNNTFDNIILTGNSDRNTLQGNKIFRGTGFNRARFGINISVSTCDNNFVTNNDLLEAGVTGNLQNLGTATVTAAGNRV